MSSSGWQQCRNSYSVPLPLYPTVGEITALAQANTGSSHPAIQRSDSNWLARARDQWESAPCKLHRRLKAPLELIAVYWLSYLHRNTQWNITVQQGVLCASCKMLMLAGNTEGLLRTGPNWLHVIDTMLHHIGKHILPLRRVTLQIKFVFCTILWGRASLVTATHSLNWRCRWQTPTAREVRTLVEDWH